MAVRERYCSECGEWSLEGQWDDGWGPDDTGEGFTVPCEECGDHAAHKCPKCGDLNDDVWEKFREVETE